MKKNLIISFMLLISILIAGCSNAEQKQENTSASYKNLSVDEAVALLQSNPNIMVIDVRTPDEIKETGIIENADNIDFKASDFKDKVSALDKSKEYLLYWYYL